MKNDVEKIQDFKYEWGLSYSHISLELTDAQILDFVNLVDTLEKALDIASDYLLSQGLAEVQE